MISLASGNLITADVDAVVNTVNTVGVAGKGIALQFRQAFPENYKAYARAAKNKLIRPGEMFVYETGRLRPRYIVNFPTKRHWRGNSRIDDIQSGLVALREVIEKLSIDSIAIPPLGCGNGGLDWADVEPLIREHLTDLNVNILVYPPAGAPDPDSMPVGTERPSMTMGRAVMLRLLHQYHSLEEYRLSALEAQKLAYFMQESGEPLRLNFSKAQYGPYAENLNHVLRVMEGHFIRGYGDRSREPKMRVMPDAIREADEFLAEAPETAHRVVRVGRLIEDWDTPYGLELLATVHWAMTRSAQEVASRDALHSYVASWTTRKAGLFKPAQIDRAVKHLADEGWVQPLEV